jgi:TP901 family phage tail tape measure protein
LAENKVLFKVLADTDQFQKSMKGASGVASRAANIMKKAFLAVGAASTGATVAFSKFEKSMTNVSTLVDTSKEDMDAMGQSLLDIAKRTPVAVGDLSSALYDVRSAGIEASRAMGVLEESARLSVAGLSSTKEATNIMTSALNAFSRENLTAKQTSDILFKTVKAGKTTISELSQAFGSTAPIIQSAGVSLADFSAATAALTTSGVPAAQAQNSLRAAIVALQKPSSNMTKIFKRLGVASGEELVQKTGSMGKAFEEVKKTSKELGLSVVEVTGRVEAAAAMTAIATVNNETYNDTLLSMQEGVNAVDEAFKKQRETLSANFQLFKNALNTTFIQFGSTVAPIASAGIQKITGLLNGLGDWFRDNAKAIKAFWDTLLVAVGRVWESVGQLFTSIGKLIGSFFSAKSAGNLFLTSLNALSIVMSTVINAINYLVEGIKDFFSIPFAKEAAVIVGGVVGLAKAFSILKTVFASLKIAFATNPFGLVLTGIVLLIAAVGKLVKNWDVAKNYIVIAFGYIQKAWVELQRAFQVGINFIVDKILFLKIQWLKLKGVFSETARAERAELQKTRDELDKNLDVYDNKITQIENKRKQMLGEINRAQEEAAATGENPAIRIEQEGSQALDILKNQKETEAEIIASTNEQKSELNNEFRQRELTADRETRATEREENDQFLAAKLEKQQEFYTMFLEGRISFEQYQRELDLLKAEQETARLQQKFFKETQSDKLTKEQLLLQRQKYMKDKQKLQSKEAGFTIAVRQREMKYTEDINAGMYENTKTFLRLMASESKSFAIAYKAIQIGESIIATHAAATKALNQVPYPANIAAAIAVVAKGMVEVMAIKRQTFASGAVEIPRDMTAEIHAGETIVPKTFAQGIRAGDLALVGSAYGGAAGATQNAVQIEVSNNNFYGSDDQMVEQIEQKIVERVNTIGSRIKLGGI